MSVIDDLADAGLVRIAPHQTGAAIERKFSLTAAGRRHARTVASVQQPGSGDAVDLSWRALQGRLRAFVEAYERAGTPVEGLPPVESSGEAAHLRALLDTGYLEETIFGSDQQTRVKPTERALSVVRLWPSAWSTAREVVDEVLAELDRQPEPEARPACEALTAGGRELVVEVLASVIAKQSGLG